MLLRSKKFCPMRFCVIIDKTEDREVVWLRYRKNFAASLSGLGEVF